MISRCTDCRRRIVALFAHRQGDDLICKSCARFRCEATGE